MPEAKNRNDKSQERGPQVGKTFFALTIFATFLLIFSLIFHFFPLGVKGQWSWEYLFPGPDLFSILFPAVLFLTLSAVLWLFWENKVKFSRAAARPYGRRARWSVLSSLVILALLFQFAIGAVGKIGTSEAIWTVIAPGASDYFGESFKIRDLREFLAAYPIYIKGEFKGGEHISTHPPGMILYWWALRKFFETAPNLTLGGKLTGRFSYAFDLFHIATSERAAVLCGIFLMRLLAALSIIPTYLLARRFCGERGGLTAAAFMVLLPATSLFSPKFDTALPIFSVGFFYLAVVASLSPPGRAGRGWAGFFAGLILSLGLLFTFAILVAAFLFLVYWLLGRWRGGWARLPRSKAAQNFSLGLLGFLVPLVLLSIFLNYNSLITWIAVYHQHAATYIIKQWTYWKWVLYNPFEFAVFLGIPISALFLGRIISGGKKLIKNPAWRPAEVFLLAFILTLLLLNFSGKSLSEVGRLWIFLMPFAIIIAVSGKRLEAENRDMVFFLLTLQFLQVIFMKLYLKVLLVGQDLSIFARG